MQLSRNSCRVLLAAAVLLLTAGSCLAAEDYRFSSRDFTGSGGLILTALPDETQGVLRCGSRILRTGDAVAARDYGTLRFTAAQDAPAVTITYLPISDGHAEAEQALTLQVFGRKANAAPTVQDLELETYKNIPNSGTLAGADPEGEALTFALDTEPQRGTVSLAPDGSFTYTPDRNKVGRDSFTFTATDAAGNVSNTGTVTVRIRKPGDKTTFDDLEGRDGAFYAMWARDQGLFSGERIAGALCFGPEQTVSRGEFVALLQRQFDLSPAGTVTVGSFADAGTTPGWLLPWLDSAVSAGLISGMQTEDGLVFRAERPITQAEAAVILQRLLQLPAAVSAPVDGVQEVWAYASVEALRQGGIRALTCSAEPLTRLQCAKLFWQASHAADTGRYGLLAWAAEK